MRSRKYPIVIAKCLSCGAEIRTSQNRRDSGRGRFCSRSCSAHYNHVGHPKPKSRENIKRATVARKGHTAWNKGELVPIKCRICGKTFYVWPSRAKRGNTRYCSRACQWQAKRETAGTNHPLWRRVQMSCEQCGAIAWVKPAKVREFRFCSRRCQGAYTAARMSERNGPTSIEKALTDELDRRGIPHRIQHPFAHFLVDITLPQFRIAIEADGDYWHSSPERRWKDGRKDGWLRAHKWTVFRFTETEIHHSASACIDTVLASI